MGHIDSRGELIADSFNMEEEVVSKIYVESLIHSLSYLTEKESSALIDYIRMLAEHLLLLHVKII